MTETPMTPTPAAPQFVRVKKAGALRSGSDSRGSVVHLIRPEDYYGAPALCGAQPSIQWSDSLGSRTTDCPRCQRKAAKMHQEVLHDR